ncbi:hypothetical protein Tco_1344787 [Tanacetum coccineum]
MLAPSGGCLILYQAYGNLYTMTGRKTHLLEDKQIPSVGVFDEVFLALGWHLEEIHVTWAHLEKKRTRLRTYTKSLEDLRIQWLKTASRVSSDGFRTFEVMVSEIWLAPRSVGPFEILERIGLLAYRLRLPEELNSVHYTFHVSNLKKCLADANLHVLLDEIKVDKTLRVGHNLFSEGQFCNGNLEVAFRSNTCYVQNLEGDDLLTGASESNLYTISISDMDASSPVYLMSKATLTKSW